MTVPASGSPGGRFRRFVLLVLDSVGIGAMPDAALWGDADSDTLGHVLAREKPELPNLRRLGLGNIRAFPDLPPSSRPAACFGKAAILSNGKDTTVGHWELAGIITPRPFPTYPGGFPEDLVRRFEAAVGCKILGNRPASGTEIIRELGAEHMRTGRPILYTSADSVFQLAAHEEVIPPNELYRMCAIAREMLDGPHRVARVIARPFVGAPGSFRRTGNRKDFAVAPPETTLLDLLAAQGRAVIGVGKVPSIFAYRGITESLPAHDNEEVMDRTIQALGYAPAGLIFANLVDFDMLWGHRNDSSGYARGLERFDRRLPELLAALGAGDVLVLTADHGCDPTTAGTDHTREYVPLLVYGKSCRGGVDLGLRATLADIGQTVAENFSLALAAGSSFLSAMGGAAG